METKRPESDPGIAGEAHATGRALLTPGEPEALVGLAPVLSGPRAPAHAVQGGVLNGETHRRLAQDRNKKIYVCVCVLVTRPLRGLAF